MKMLSKNKFIEEAGSPIFQARDFSLYDGSPYECACGSVHRFQQYAGAQHFQSSGARAKFMVQCPDNTNTATLIETRNKFLVMFDRFVSLAGHIGSDN